MKKRNPERKSKSAAAFHRKTKETDISVSLKLGGKKRPAPADINTPIGFMNHMLEAFSYHGGFCLKVKATGDTQVDDHHTVEDLGICLGEDLKKIIKKGKGLTRFGSAVIPMDEALALVAIDISGRPFLSFKVEFSAIRKSDFDFRLIEDFFRAVSNTAGITIHVISLGGRDNHHMSEAVFKAFGIALGRALASSGKGIPSTKGLCR